MDTLRFNREEQPTSLSDRRQKGEACPSNQRACRNRALRRPCGHVFDLAPLKLPDQAFSPFLNFADAPDLTRREPVSHLS